jgi:hypothetical protein
MKRTGSKGSSRSDKGDDMKKSSRNGSRSNAGSKKDHSDPEGSKRESRQSGFSEQDNIHRPSPIDLNEWTISVP